MKNMHFIQNILFCGFSLAILVGMFGVSEVIRAEQAIAKALDPTLSEVRGQIDSVADFENGKSDFQLWEGQYLGVDDLSVIDNTSKGFICGFSMPSKSYYTLDLEKYQYNRHYVEAYNKTLLKLKFAAL